MVVQITNLTLQVINIVGLRADMTLRDNNVVIQITNLTMQVINMVGQSANMKKVSCMS